MKISVLPIRHYFLLLIVFITLLVDHFVHNKSRANPAVSIEKLDQPSRENKEMPTMKMTRSGVAANAATILARRQVPILCYHQVREFRPADSKTSRDYIVPPSVFIDQMKVLADSGYHTILPDELYSYLAYGTPLPENPIMLSFDDSDLEQFSVATPEMKQHERQYPDC